jgi:hypothetical protein
MSSDDHADNGHHHGRGEHPDDNNGDENGQEQLTDEQLLALMRILEGGLPASAPGTWPKPATATAIGCSKTSAAGSPG